MGSYPGCGSFRNRLRVGARDWGSKVMPRFPPPQSGLGAVGAVGGAGSGTIVDTMSPRHLPTSVGRWGVGSWLSSSGALERDWGWRYKFRARGPLGGVQAMRWG